MNMHYPSGKEKSDSKGDSGSSLLPQAEVASSLGSEDGPLPWFQWAWFHWQGQATEP